MAFIARPFLYADYTGADVGLSHLKFMENLLMSLSPITFISNANAYFTAIYDAFTSQLFNLRFSILFKLKSTKYNQLSI